ncbi:MULTISPECIES: hypothetical protein [unclassified Rhizobium]|uniref:hypothetical protein n=1 Tax=unclassified Rhizobium TaxID=2613769 RepID=UPI000A640DAE|nr:MULTISPECIES: hypothetical protein [unclassified Rhizobium]
MKLTKPQMELLRDVANGGTAVESYPPARKLVELGLCVRQTVGLSDRLEITEAGRQAMKEYGK